MLYKDLGCRLNVVSNDTNFLFLTLYQQRFVCKLLNYVLLLLLLLLTNIKRILRW